MKTGRVDLTLLVQCSSFGIMKIIISSQRGYSFGLSLGSKDKVRKLF